VASLVEDFKRLEELKAPGTLEARNLTKASKAPCVRNFVEQNWRTTVVK
jgi:hypothetical protein